MLLLLSHILFSLFAVGFYQDGSEKGVTRFTVSDSISIEIYAHYDNHGLPDLYGTRTFTPVCEGKKCYAIEIDFYWDLLGRYHHFDTVPGKGLTKLDHIPFEKSDYARLDTLLRDRYSLLSSYTLEELVKDTRSSSIDGFTGATIEEVKENIVEGAVYSCYTLWHIVNGAVSDSLKKVSRKMFSQELVQKLVALGDQEINYFLINSFTPQEFLLYLPEVLQTISNGRGYFPKNAIERIPDDIICDSLAQAFFAKHYPQLDYFAQIALLESLNAKDLSGDLKTCIARDSKEREGQERDSYKYELVKNLIAQ